MARTPNHGYNVPSEGEENWHDPLNENFRQYDTDIEVRDVEADRGDYEPKEGAKFFATDTGAVYVGDGANWNRVPTTGRQPTLSAVNTGGTDLGVGTGSPATKLHVADDPAKNGAMDLSRPAAVVENTSGDPKGDVLGLKTHVSNPDGDTDFLSFIGGSTQVGQLNGNGSTGVRLAGTESLALAAGGGDHVYVGENGVVSLDFVGGGSLTTTSGGTGSNPGFFVGDGFTMWVAEDTVRVFASDLQVDGDLDVGGSKNFVQAVDTDAGEREVVYTASEAPTPRTEATGVAELDDGRAEIALPDHFGWVTDAEEPIHVQTTPYSADTGGLAVVERSTDHLVVEDVDGDGDYEFSYTVRGTREGYADEAVVREPGPTGEPGGGEAPADD